MVNKMNLLYATKNPAKLDAMRKRLTPLGLTIYGLNEIGIYQPNQKDIKMPDIIEDGLTPLENATKKAKAYFEAFHVPVFSCDSGMYFDHVPDEDQPSVHVRTVNGKYLSDDEMIIHYTNLVKKYGELKTHYKNAICLVLDENTIFSAMDADMESRPFLITDKPHAMRKKGFPIDSISLEINSGKYFYDIAKEELDEIAVESGFLRFFKGVINAL